MLRHSEDFLIQKCFFYLNYTLQNNFHSSLSLKTNYHQVLGVNRNANQKEIKDAYLKLCKLHHPDMQSTTKLTKEERVKKFQSINEAYNNLIKPDAKQSSFDDYSEFYKSGFRRYPRYENYRPYQSYDFRYHDFRNNFRNTNAQENFARYQTYQKETTKHIRVLIFSFLIMFFYVVSIRLTLVQDHLKHQRISSEYNDYYKRNVKKDD